MKANDVKKSIWLVVFAIIAINSTKMINLIIFIKLILATLSKKFASKQKKVNSAELQWKQKMSKMLQVGIFCCINPWLQLILQKMIILIFSKKIILATSSKKHASKQRLTGQNCDESKRCQKNILVGIFCHNCN